MLKQLSCAASLCGLVLIGGPAFAINEDPCGDVFCDENDECLACWEESNGIIECAELTLREYEVICTEPQGLQVTAPQGPRGPVLLDVGRGQTLPQTPQPQLQLEPTLPQ